MTIFSIIILMYLSLQVQGWNSYDRSVLSNIQTIHRRVCGVNKICVEKQLCKSNEIVRDASGIFSPRFANICNNQENCCDMGNSMSTVVNPLDESTLSESNFACGYRNPNGFGEPLKNYQNDEAKFAEFPWMVGILREVQVDNSAHYIYHSGGSLLAPTVVVTTAHNTYNVKAKDLIVTAGEWNYLEDIEPLPAQSRRVQHIIVHEEFDFRNAYNDIALLFVQDPFVYRDNVRSICLPPPTHIFDYARCFSSGWGKKNFGPEGTNAVILKKHELPVMSKHHCESSLRMAGLSSLFQLHKSFICAGGEEGNDMCTGDGGSPLVCPIANPSDRYYLTGMVSWGLACNRKDVPGVYTNVANLHEWIDEELRKKNIDSRYYTK